MVPTATETNESEGTALGHNPIREAGDLGQFFHPQRAYLGSSHAILVPESHN